MASQNKWILVLGLCIIALLGYNLTRDDSAEETPQPPAPQNHVEKSVWRLFSPKNNLFEVLLPSRPQHVTETKENGGEFTKYDVYLAQDKHDNIFLISVTQYPESYGMGSVDNMLLTVQNGAVASNPANKLTESERGTFLDLPSLYFAYSSPDADVRSKAIVRDHTLIVLTVMDRDPNRLDSDFNTFIGSFNLKNTSGS